MPSLPPNRRDDLVDAFCDLVLDEGDRAATLAAVAAQAGVSKGGLLYHFPSKQALVEGLCERFERLVAEDLPDGESPSEWYLRTSAITDSRLERTMGALIRLAPTHEGLIRPVLRRARDTWFNMIREELGDDRLVHAVVFLGDGIAFHAEAYGADDDHQLASGDTVDGLLDLVRALRALRK